MKPIQAPTQRRKDIQVWRPPRSLDGDSWAIIGKEVRRCYNRACMDTFTSAPVCLGCGLPTQKVGGEPCEPSNGNGSGSNGKARTRKKSRS